MLQELLEKSVDALRQMKEEAVFPLADGAGLEKRVFCLIHHSYYGSRSNLDVFKGILKAKMHFYRISD